MSNGFINTSNDVVVSSGQELLSALGYLSGGEVIYLAPGDYGSVVLEGFIFDEAVTIVSEPAGQVTIENLTVIGSTNLVFEGIHFESPTNGTSASSIVSIKDSDYIQINHSEINGPVDEIYDGHVGLRVTDSSNVNFEGNFIHDVKRAGVFENSDHLVVAGNTADYLGDDNYKFIGVNDVLIENNIGARYVFPSEGAHLDFIQFQGSDSSDIVIRGNVLLPENQTSIQGIFLDDAHYTNVLIEQNIIVTGMIRGISLSSGTNVVARDNTVLDIDGVGSKATKVMVDGESYGNIQGSYLQDAEVSNNLTLQQADPSRALHYDDVFKNATVGLGMDIVDLTPIPGSLAEEYGAQERLLQLLGQASDSTETPVDPPDFDVEEPPDDVKEVPNEAGDGNPETPNPVRSLEKNDSSGGFFDWLQDLFSLIFGVRSKDGIEFDPEGGRDALVTTPHIFELEDLYLDVSDFAQETDESMTEEVETAEVELF